MAGIGHELLSIIHRFALQILSTLDPASATVLQTGFAPPAFDSRHLPQPQNTLEAFASRVCVCGDGGNRTRVQER
ncbi:MAG: hypothetical protein QG609_336 [Patescibacteria group bacterium]|nr:hypothetical protein [Patescibacteria group bacterium]